MVNFFLKFSLESKDGKLLHNGERGKLVVVEGAQDIPFEIKRVFYIYMALTTRLSAENMRTRKMNLSLSMLPGNQRCALQTESASMLLSLTAPDAENLSSKNGLERHVRQKSMSAVELKSAMTTFCMEM